MSCSPCNGRRACGQCRDFAVRAVSASYLGRSHTGMNLWTRELGVNIPDRVL